MKGKRVFYCEIAYIAGMILLAIGTSFMEKAGLGMSMVVAPAYILHVKMAEIFPWFTFGMSGYVYQAILLVVLWAVMRKFEKSYLLSFVTAFIYGFVLDAVMRIVALIPFEGVVWQVVFYAAGLVICTMGVALLLHAHFPPEAYDLFVKEVSRKFNTNIGKVKTIYDCCSCILGIVLSLAFFQSFVGVKWGTIVCAFVNGWLIGWFSRYLEDHFTFKEGLFFKSKKTDSL